MPDGMDSSSPENKPDVPLGAPLDGLRPPSSEKGKQTQNIANKKANPQPEPQPEAVAATNQKTMLLMILAGGAAFLLFYLFFAFYLMASLPSVDGGGQGLKLIGNLLYASISVLSITALVMIALRYLRAGMEPAELLQPLMKPGILVLIMLMIAIMVFATINRNIPLVIDILEPPNIHNLTAPVSVTFGTDSLRSILRKQNLTPKKYKWDFNGDGVEDALTIENEVTTVYSRKGSYRVLVTMQLSDNSVRTASTVINIPSAVFDLSPLSPLIDEKVMFDVSNLITNSDSIEKIVWDFNGDGEMDDESTEMNIEYTFTEIGTYQSEAKIQHKGGLQETYIRPVTVLLERKQPFAIEIDTEGDLQGSAPLGIMFHVTVEEGITVSKTEWSIVGKKFSSKGNETLSGNRITYVFDKDGEYRVTVTVTDNRGRKAEKTLKVIVLDSLKLTDIVISGTPKPSKNSIEGIAPLEVKLNATTQTPFISFKWEQENASEVFSFEDIYHAIYKEEGTFPVVLIAKDAQERTQKYPLEIKVLPPRSRIEFSAVPSTGIAPLTVSFDASQSYVPDGRITGFSWLFGDGGREEKAQLLGSKATHKYETEGEFKVVVRALTEDGRSFEARKTIVVRSPTLHACVFPSRTTGPAPMGVRFDASCSTGKIDVYSWDFGDGATSEQKQATQDHVFEAPGVYEVQLEISDGQGNFNTATVTITVNPQ